MEERLAARLRRAGAKGDDVLSVVALSLSTMVRTGGDVTRFGGDEYVIVIGPVSEGDLEAFAARVCIAVNESWIK